MMPEVTANLTPKQKKLVAAVLYEWFPWLATDEPVNSCADVVQDMGLLYRALCADDLANDPARASKKECFLCARKIRDAEYLVNPDGLPYHFCCPAVSR